MNILLIHQYFLEDGMGGGSRFNEMTRLWAQKGHKITVVAGMVHYAKGMKSKKYKGKFIVREQEGENVLVYRCHVSDAYNSNFVGRLWSYFSFVFSCAIGCILFARGRYDLLLATSPPLTVALPAMFVSFIKRIPLVFEVRDLWPESAIDAGVLTNTTLIRLAYCLEAAVYKKSRLVNTLTPAFRKKLIEEKSVPSRKVIMVPNAAEFSVPDALHATFDNLAFRRKNGINARFVATYVGAHGLANHLIQVIQTAHALRQHDMLFLLIGEGMQKPWLIEQAKSRALNNIRFINTIAKEQVYEYILASDVGMSVLKKCETFKTIYSNKTFDYMACKRPILMAIDGISRELIESAQCGLYVEPENVEDFCGKALFYYNNPVIAQAHGENGYRYSKSNFDRSVLAGEYLERLHSVAQESHRC